MTIPNWRRTLKKLQSMDRHEIADRCRQEYGKRRDGVLARLHYDFARHAVVQEPVRPGAFFFAAEQIEPLLERLRQRLPQPPLADRRVRQALNHAGASDANELQAWRAFRVAVEAEGWLAE